MYIELSYAVGDVSPLEGFLGLPNLLLNGELNSVMDRTGVTRQAI